MSSLLRTYPLMVTLARLQVLKQNFASKETKFFYLLKDTHISEPDYYIINFIYAFELEGITFQSMWQILTFCIFWK